MWSPCKHHLWNTLRSLFKSILLSIWKIPVQIKKTALEFMLHSVLSLEHIYNPLLWLATHLGFVVRDEQCSASVDLGLSSKTWCCLASGQTFLVTLRKRIWLIEGALTTKPWDIQLQNLLVPVHIFKLPLSPSSHLPHLPPLPSAISWPVYSECKCVHCVTALSLYCVCLLKCGVKWLLISEHRLTAYNQLCARVASSASLHSQIARNSAQNSSCMHTYSAHCSSWKATDLNNTIHIQTRLQSQRQNSRVFLFILCFICCHGSTS